MTAPTVVGVDLSLTATGVATAAGLSTLTPPFTPRTEAEELDRIVWVREQVVPLCVDADLVAIEGLSYGSRGGKEHERGALSFEVRLALRRFKVRYALVPPKSLKRYAAGKGNATKPDMRMALYQRLGLDVRDDNQVDAAWLRVMGMDACGHPLVDMPKAQREALAKIDWPGAVSA